MVYIITHDDSVSERAFATSSLAEDYVTNVLSRGATELEREKPFRIWRVDGLNVQKISEGRLPSKAIQWKHV